MQTFKDRAGRTWQVEINVWQVKRVRALLGGFDLLKLLDDRLKGLSELATDPEKMVDVLYVLCKDEADARNVSDEQFGRSMSNDSLADGRDAFLAEYADFFQDPATRDNIKKVIAKIKEVQGLAAQQMTAILDGMTAEDLLRKAQEEMGRREQEGQTRDADEPPPPPEHPSIGNGKSGDSPASSASTPAPSPSAS